MNVDMPSEPDNDTFRAVFPIMWASGLNPQLHLVLLSVSTVRGNLGAENSIKTCSVNSPGPSLVLRRGISGLQKGPGERGHVNKRQKSSNSVKTFFDTFRQFSRRAKNVKNRQKVSKRFSTLFDNFRTGLLPHRPFAIR